VGMWWVGNLQWLPVSSSIPPPLGNSCDFPRCQMQGSLWF
jgi:hypothetical protein